MPRVVANTDVGSALRSRLWWLLAAYGLLLFGATHTPSEALPAEEFVTTSDKLIHFTAYAVLGCLVAACLTPRGGRLSAKAGIAVVVSIAVAAAIDEYTQPWVNRTCDPLDWVADVAGTSTAVASYGAWTRWRRR